MKPKKSAALELVKLCAKVLDDKKAEDIRILDVSAQSSITDFMVVATGTSEPHLRALRVELEKAIDAARVHIMGMETAQDSGWLVIDMFDVMLHLFLPDPRKKYGLENLWKDAKEISLRAALAAPRVRKAAAKKTASRRKIKS